MLELMGLNSERIDPLDGNTSSWRRVYFWRKTFLTLVEIQKTLNKISGLPEFKTMLANEPTEVQQQVAKHRKELNKACNDFLSDLRNTIAGHLDEKAMQCTLDTMNWGRNRLIELGETAGKIHYKFASELILSVPLRGTPETDAEAKLHEILGRTAALTPLFLTIDEVVKMYMKSHIPV